MSDKPKFDPTKPFEAVGADAKPQFDPSKPFEAALDDAPPAPASPEGYDLKGAADAVMRGVAQGATMDFADEAAGALGGAYDWAAGKLGARGGISLSDAYHTRRDAARRGDAKAQADHPVVYGASQLGGALAASIVTPGLRAPVAQGPALETATGLVAPKLVQSLGRRVATGAAQGAVFGAVGKAGAADEITDVPGAMLEGAGWGGALGGALPLAAAGAKAVAKRAAPVAAKIIGGIPEPTFQKYVQGRERINALAAQGDDAVKDAVDAGVASVVADKASAASRAAAAEDVLERGYLAKQAELAGAVTPLTKAKEMTAALEAQKGYLGSLSEQADDALVRSGATFKKTDLLRAIDKIGHGQGAAIGDEAHAALAKLQTTRDRIAEQLPDEIPARQMRDVLKQLRRDVSFDQAAGEFNDTLTGMRKDFSRRISEALKKASPEYSHYMARMSDLADSLATMNRYFGDESKALGSLETLRKGGSRAQLIEDAMQRHATVNGDQTMLEQLAGLRQNQTLLGRIKGGEDLRRELFPEAWKAVQETRAEAEMAAQVASPIERLSPVRTQAVIKNQGGASPNIVDRRALEALETATGTPVRQMIDDQNVAQAFRKGNRTGARMTAMGATIGGGLGGALAGPLGAGWGTSIGGAIGGTLDMYGPALIKRAIDASAAAKAALASTEGVKRLGPYAAVLAREAKKGNEAFVAANAYLLASDPNYGKLLEQRTDIDQRREAIKRRASGQ